jgi:hypothetical protein
MVQLEAEPHRWAFVDQAAGDRAVAKILLAIDLVGEQFSHNSLLPLILVHCPIFHAFTPSCRRMWRWP